MTYYTLVIHLVELIAALAGTYYYLKTRDNQVKIFIWYLWLTVAVETLGMYGYVLQNNYDHEWFIWIKNSVFCSNRWLYNIYLYVSLILISMFFKTILQDRLSKIIIKFSIIVYAVSVLFYFSVSDSFFIKSIPYDMFLETLLVVIFVMLYYRQLLKSDKILFFYRSPIFYLSSGLLLWYLVITPLFIFDTYFYLINDNFLKFRDIYITASNIFLYLCYTFGFLFSLQYKKQ